MSENIYTIYKITNLVNNKIYIGFTCRNIKIRFNGHIYDSKSGDSTCYLHRAIKKYKSENFIIEAIYQSKNQDYTLKTMESYFIKEYNSNDPKFGYNMTNGGEGSIGFKHSKKSKIKMSEYRKGRPTWNKNKKHTEEHKKHISEKVSLSKNPRARKIKITNVYGQEYISNGNLKYVCKDLNLSWKTIFNVLKKDGYITRGKNKGYKIEYIN